MSNLQWNKEFALEQTGDDAELLEELLTLFVDSSAGDLANLRAAVEAGDADQVVRASHSIKGASASLGLETIREVALAMETDARAGSVAVAAEKMDALTALLEEVKKL
jgi:HPt (histidine-containing phosphotransfer) domain-containing protein